MKAPLRVLGLAGSLRQHSYNKALLRAAQELTPEGMVLDLFDLADVPLFNADVEAEGDPPPVVALKQAIREADALLLATPEYNGGVPAVTKNALDWASRPPRPSVLHQKPVALIGASPGLFGTVRAQLHLREVLSALSAYTLPKPELRVGRAKDKFDEEGRLTDEKTRGSLQKLLAALARWTHMVAEL